MKTKILKFWAFLLFISFLLVVASLAATVQEEPVVITHHQIEAEGKPLQYTAETGRIAIRDVETGEPHGYVFYIAMYLDPPTRLEFSKDAKEMISAIRRRSS